MNFGLKNMPALTKEKKAVKQTVVFAHHEGVIGGAERVTLATIEAISLYYNVVLLSPEGELQREAKKLGAHTESVTWTQPSLRSPIKTVRSQFTLTAILKKYQPSIVHTGDILALRALYFSCKRYNIKLICHVHYPYSEAFIRWVFDKVKSVSAFLYCSKELKDNLSPKLAKSVSSKNHVAIHNGVDTKKFSPRQSSTSSSLQAIGIIANLQRRKGHDDFLQMAKLLLSENSSLTFHIIGGDILEEPRQHVLEKLASQLGITENIKFHGQVSNVEDYIHDLDIVVCASHTEAFPITILEAMACEKPIVTTNVNGIIEAVDSSSAILVDPHSPDQLASGVSLLLNDPILAHRLAKEARRTVCEKYSSDCYAHSILALYQTVLDET